VVDLASLVVLLLLSRIPMRRSEEEEDLGNQLTLVTPRRWWRPMVKKTLGLRPTVMESIKSKNIFEKNGILRNAAKSLTFTTGRYFSGIVFSFQGVTFPVKAG
jgi:hypothetical protein